MTRDEMETVVGDLLLEQERLRRFHLNLPPDKLMLLKRLLYRLGWKTQMKRKQLPQKYAKVDGHVQAHHLVAGFPIEIALRHLANDPKNSGNVRDLALIALTGKGKFDTEATKEGKPEALWALHDALRDDNHPAAKWYNWMSAADKVSKDAKVYEALKRSAEDVRRLYPHFNEYQRSPEAEAIRISHENKRGHLYEPTALRRFQSHIGAVAPEMTPGEIKESLKRHTYRATMHFNSEHGASNEIHEKNAIAPLKKVGKSYAENEKVSRYKRRMLLRFAKFTLSKPTPILMGQMHEHTYHDEAGNPVGKVFLSVHDNGETVHVHSIGGINPREAGNPVNAHGPEAMRSLLTQLKVHYPGVKRVTGNRVSGFRKTTPGGENVNIPLRNSKKYSLRRNDFLDSLRRIQSSNQQALHKIAEEVSQKLGLTPTKVLNALHDTPTGSMPGIAQAIYGKASPEQIHTAASWIGLTGGMQGVAAFHLRPNGPDTLYRFRQEGSGLDIRSKLDRAGISQRVLIPHRKGFDVIIPDKGSQLAPNVQSYSQAQGLTPEESRGFFHTVGAADSGDARAKFRDSIVKGEQGQSQTTKSETALAMKRKSEKPKKYSEQSETEGFHHQFTTQEHGEKSISPIYADWLQDRGKDQHAEIIRADAAINHFGTSPWVRDLELSHLNPGEFGYATEDSNLTYAPEKTRLIVLSQRATQPGDAHMTWMYPIHPDQEKEVTENLKREGARHINNYGQEEPSPLLPPKEPIQESRVSGNVSKYSAFANTPTESEIKRHVNAAKNYANMKEVARRLELESEEHDRNGDAMSAVKAQQGQERALGEAARHEKVTRDLSTRYGLRSHTAYPHDEETVLGILKHYREPPALPKSHDPIESRPNIRLSRVGRPKKYNHQAFLDKIGENERDTNHRAVYADWLEENAPESVNQTTLDRLRNYQGRMHVALSSTGKVLAIPTVTKKWLEGEGAARGAYHRTSRNSKGDAHRVRFSGRLQTWKRDPERYRIPWKFGLYNNGEITPSNEHEWLTEDPTDEPVDLPRPTQLSRRVTMVKVPYANNGTK